MPDLNKVCAALLYLHAEREANCHADMQSTNTKQLTVRTVTYAHCQTECKVPTHLESIDHQVLAVLLQQLKQLTVFDASHLQNLGRAIAQMPLVKSLQEGLVNEDC